jgi:hypothetical protein
MHGEDLISSIAAERKANRVSLLPLCIGKKLTINMLHRSKIVQSYSLRIVWGD